MENKHSLYTKYRPKNFDEVVGQNVAKKILVNSIFKNKINHAYLFYGIRGTGKTTLARIFAKAINCPNLKDSNPCNQCEICESINNGSSFDIVEIDAASNNGVDEIRTIKENTTYLTTSTKYKVYIIDEVHMLTKQAFNALLKTLEEPPKNIVFLLATTEIHKIPKTVLSRALIVNLESMSLEDIKMGLKIICDKENIEYDQKALEYIAIISNGSLRDAISYLETTLLYNDNLSTKNVVDSLSLIDKEEIERMILENKNELIYEISKENKDYKKISLLISEVLIELIKKGNKKYVFILNKILNFASTINDPLLLKVALQNTFYFLDVSRETTENSNNKFLKSNVENTNSLNHNSNSTLLKQGENTNNTSLKNVENSSLNKKIIEEKKLDSKNLSSQNYVITDFADVNNYMYIIKKNNKTELARVLGRWRFLDTYNLGGNHNLISSTLIKTKPLAATNKTIIVGFYDDNQIDEFKKISLTREYFSFIKEMLGDHKFILPITSKTWSKLLSVKDDIELRNVHTDLNIEVKDFMKSEIEESRKKMEDLFGKNNITYE